MSAVDYLREILHQVASVLMWPVLIGLLAVTVATLVALGAFTREAWDRVRGTRLALDRDRRALSDAAGGGCEPLDLRLEAVLHAVERRRWRAVNRVRLAVRVGPSLGLMGTLIPMASALQGLAEGNLPALVSNMVTAFAATVIGLSVSVVAYLVSAVRENWLRADIEALTFHAERLARASSPPTSKELTECASSVATGS
ncbi:MAG: MotA/TolQ/ExbB proton channel family protein, partial [Vicinamibacteraceae bacterium]